MTTLNHGQADISTIILVRNHIGRSFQKLKREMHMSGFSPGSVKVDLKVLLWFRVHGIWQNQPIFLLFCKDSPLFTWRSFKPPLFFPRMRPGFCKSGCGAIPVHRQLASKIHNVLAHHNMGRLFRVMGGRRNHGSYFFAPCVRSDRVKSLAPIPGFSKVNEIQQGNRQVIVYGSNSKVREIAPL